MPQHQTANQIWIQNDITKSNQNEGNTACPFSAREKHFSSVSGSSTKNRGQWFQKVFFFKIHPSFFGSALLSWDTMTIQIVATAQTAPLCRYWLTEMVLLGAYL